MPFLPPNQHTTNVLLLRPWFVGCKNAALAEERRALRQRCAEFQTALRAAESASSRLSAELGSCRGQLSAVQSRVERVEAASAATTRRDGELQTVNAALRRDVDHAQRQVRRPLYRSQMTLNLSQKTTQQN